ncbi:mitoguardin 2 isoform X1 [Ursus maritimus]|uniref:Mitoguardin 2 n=1 Tax=Ursus maritimus TaxID=29073 RepID=A0A8M1G0E2_URSMA|nr:mitoguardin 2 isoform X1 [Ursus maritimus]
MAFRRTEGMSMMQALAMTVAEIPVFLYTTFGQSAFSQLRLTPGLRKVLFATALGTVALALAAHQLKRRRRRKKQVGPEMGGAHLGTVPLPILMARKVPSVKKGYSSRRMQSPSSKSNDTLSGISSIEPSKHSGSSHSLASMVAVNSSSPTAACSGPWDARGLEESVTTSDGNAESLYMQGMELFEEALQKWEQALSVGQRGDSSSTPTPGDSLRNPETASEVLLEPESQRREFAEKLESLLHRAYHLQEEFGSTFPADSVLLDLERTLMLPLTEGSLRLRGDDEDSLTSEDSFFSATELFESLQAGDDLIPLSRPAAAYEEALQLVKEGKVPCRTLRTELLGCYSDQDFLAKLHCVRQAFEGLLEDKSNQLFFGEVGRQMVTGLMTKAEKAVLLPTEPQRLPGELRGDDGLCPAARDLGHHAAGARGPWGGVYELLRYCAGLHPHGRLRGPGEPPVLGARRPEEPLAVRQLQGDGPGHCLLVSLESQEETADGARWLHLPFLLRIGAR